jgi:hypothetical protein
MRQYDFAPGHHGSQIAVADLTGNLGIHDAKDHKIDPHAKAASE